MSAFAAAAPGREPADVETPEVLLKKLQPLPGFTVDLIAREPQLLNPVAFSIDEHGRIYVAETYRLHDGVTDIRGHSDWLLDDLACRTVADQEALLRKHLGAKAEKWASPSEQIRLLEDTNGDGRIDTSRVYAGGFDGLISGIGSGVLARGGSVWYTNIPDLWLLRDTTGDGLADTRRPLSTGYGVHISFIGHDSHGLTFGPDGRIYFSIGDRGLHVTTPDGPLAYPDTGAVLRCEPDGSGLEVYAYGLRNPQELAFDSFGNLFTGDNNSDGGDKARLVNIIEGGDSGWRIGYQSLDDRGPWNGEKLWHLGDHAASQIPPVAHIGRGPSGLTFNPGTGMPRRYHNHFFMCDFPGGVRSFAVEAKGSSFEAIDDHPFLWNMYPTDVDFSPSGGLYVLDWVEGWAMPQKGRIFHVYDPQTRADPLVAETRSLLAEDWNALPFAALADRISRQRLLGHPDRRVRQAVQFALTAHGMQAYPLLKSRAAQAGDELEQLHIIWGIGQIARKDATAAEALRPLLNSSRQNVRGQAARVLGDSRLTGVYDDLVKLLRDPHPRVCVETALALGRYGRQDAIPHIVSLLRKAENQDPYVRHAGVMALTRLAQTADLIKLGRDESPAVRLAVVVALRRLNRPEIAMFLDDPDPRVVLETARAINDVPIEAATAALAALPMPETRDEPTLRRILYANFRIGGDAAAQSLAACAARAEVAEPLRAFALRLLEQWPGPAHRDLVTGAWRPLPARDAAPARDALAARFDVLLRGPTGLQIQAIRSIAALKGNTLNPRLRALVDNHELPGDVRAEALRALATLHDEQLSSAVLVALRDTDPPVVRQAVGLLAEAKVPDSLARLEHVIFSDAPIPTRQAAIAALARVRTPQGVSLVSKCLEELIAGRFPSALHLDVIECAQAARTPQIKEDLSRYTAARANGDAVEQRLELLEGGDPVAGRRVFEKQEAMCLKCHTIDGRGGQVGPDLSGVGAARTRRQLLESLLLPNKEIAPEFRTVVLFTDDETHVGRVMRETPQEIVILDAEGHLRPVSTSAIQDRRQGLSAMPENVTELLSPREIRDLVAYLATLKSPSTRPN